LTSPGARSRPTWPTVAVLLAAALLAGIGVKMIAEQVLGGSPPTLAVVVSNPARADLQFEIPADVATRLARGERLTLLPSPLRVRVGDLLKIRNDSDQGQYVGPFFVAARSVLTERFTAPGTLQGECVLHPSGRLVIEVSGDRTRR
jgi:hypothetical protein